VKVTEKTPVNTIDVLVAAVDVPLGNTLKAGDVKWLPWPADYVPEGIIRKDKEPNADKDLSGSIARAPFLNAEPIRRERLIKSNNSSFLSAILPSGKRAIAINTDTRGSNSAGGFVLPNDRVDVVRLRREDSAAKEGREVYVSETILTNIRVLAIGTNVQEKDGEKTVIGETATLELDPKQVEAVALAQKQGTLALSLRSIADANDFSKASEFGDGGSITVVRFGVSQTNVKR
ncbi:MAG: Flp pilus assembly protein CpaB, partial [Aestuariivirga sp.]